jgi:hypothetical protein
MPQHLSKAVIVAAFALGAAKAANAITLPDHGACNSTEFCLQIQNLNGGVLANGLNTAASGGGAGVSAETDTGYGALGIATTTGIGVYGTSQNGIGVYATSTNGIALRAQSSNNSDAIQGLSSSNGSGGYFANTSGAGNGIYVSASGYGMAVHGVNTASIGWAGYFQGNVYSSGSYQSSDARLKKDIKDGQYGLGEILKLRPVTFKWKADDDGKVQLGLIAQEVSKLVPEVVHTDSSSGMLSVNYVALLPVMVKAVQEQQKLIQKQDARIAALEREHSPISSAILPTRATDALLLGMFPLGLVAAFRRRQK